jgi:hypothetical protein
MIANSMDPIPTPIDGIPTIPGTNDVSPHIPTSAVQPANEQGLPTIGTVTFVDVMQQTFISIPLDCNATNRIITDFGYVLLVEDTAIDAKLFLGDDATGQTDPNSKTGTLTATIRKTTPRPGLKVTVLTKKVVPA